MRRMLTRTATSFLLAAVASMGAIIQVHVPEEVAPHASHVVLARLDIQTKTATILRELRGRTGAKKITIENLGDTPLVGLPNGPIEAWLFLDRTDHRYFLVRRSSPLWILPHSSIFYRHKQHACTWHQPTNPGPLQLSARWTEAEFEKLLRTWLKAPQAKRPFRPNLPEADADRFYAAIKPFVDFHGRRIAVEPHNADELLAGLRKFAGASKGEALRRAVEVHLILANTKTPQGSLALERVAAVERSLAELLRHVPRELAIATLLDELRATDVQAGKAAAAHALRGYPKALPEAKKILVGHIRKGSTLGSRSYWALRRMGFRKEADEANER